MKIVSSAVERTARWDVHRTSDQIPVGGLTFIATMLVPRAQTSLDIGAKVTVELGTGDRSRRNTRKRSRSRKPLRAPKTTCRPAVTRVNRDGRRSFITDFVPRTNGGAAAGGGSCSHDRTPILRALVCGAG